MIQRTEGIALDHLKTRFHDGQFFEFAIFDESVIVENGQIQID